MYILLVCYIPIVEIFLPKTNFGAGIPDIGPVRFTSYVLVMVFLLNIAATKKNIPLNNKWSVNLLWFSIIVLLSVAWSKESFNASTIAAIFDSVYVPFIVSLIALDLFKEKENVDSFVKNLCIAVFFLSLISLYMLLFASKSNVAEDEVFRSAGFGKLGNSNGLAIFLVMAIPCILYGIKQNIFQKKIVGWLILFSVYGGVICTVSRKGLVTMFLATSIYFFLTKQFGKILICFVFSLGAIILLYGYSTHNNSASRFEKDEIEHQLSGRSNMALAGVKMFISSPIIGKGYRGYHNNWKQYFPFSKVDKYSAHNIFVTALANYGVIGFVPFMAIFLYPVFVSLKVLRSRISFNNVLLNDMAIICISTVPCFMINGYFAGGLFYNPVIMILLYSIISFTISAYTKSRHERTTL
ncbi:O-antigen ligase family protein [Desulfamplus magnetovallimortis]|uniref:O-antigen ligase family protein n=1 Tax=Desulfamplus magnetovallimortis TaxID=1246637 RepID=UPI0016492FA2|nr:O-antigen ligase family protein [Desulfamplus magnetovallimortis]